jgi:phospholipid transport system substrate-binding protein
MRLRGWVYSGILLGLCGVLSASVVGAETENPTQLVQRLVKAIGSIKVGENGQLSEAEKTNNAKAAQDANAILDIPEVSKWTLGKHWEALSPAQRQEFSQLLAQLFAKIAYPKSAEFFSGLNIAVAGERTTAQGAVVKTTVTHPKEGLVAIDYRLARSNDSWRVRDIILDDVSLATNLRSQFHKIIAEHSYAELLRLMREKLAE